MSQLANASATSLNFIGFEDQRGQGMPEILYNQVFIEPNQSYTAGVASPRRGLYPEPNRT